MGWAFIPRNWEPFGVLTDMLNRISKINTGSSNTIFSPQLTFWHVNFLRHSDQKTFIPSTQREVKSPSWFEFYEHSLIKSIVQKHTWLALPLVQFSPCNSHSACHVPVVWLKIDIPTKSPLTTFLWNIQKIQRGIRNINKNLLHA